MSTKRHAPRLHTRLYISLLATGALAIAACSIAIKQDRNFSAIPPGQIGFDDMCQLQDYFDSLEAKVAKPPQVVSSLDLEGGDGVKTVRGGKAKLAFEGEFLLKHVKRVLTDNWQKLPEELGPAQKVELEVRWVEKASVKRVVTDQESELIIGGDTWALPYHPCLSEFLYGEPLYKQRRELWGLPAPVPAESDGGLAASVTNPDGGAPATSTSDAAAHE
jgi:hypothetical protein